jgi:hypothetical protein
VMSMGQDGILPERPPPTVFLRSRTMAPEMADQNEPFSTPSRASTSRVNGENLFGRSAHLGLNNSRRPRAVAPGRIRARRIVVLTDDQRFR